MRDDRTLLLDILEAINNIEEFSELDRELFFTDRKTQSAVVRQIEIIGEASNKLSPDFKAAHTAMDWRALSTFRHVLIHAYWDRRMGRTWAFIERQMPGLKEYIVNWLKSA